MENPNKDSECKYDAKLKTVIHKFKIGTAVCCCGAMTVEKPKLYGGWKKLHNKEQ